MKIKYKRIGAYLIDSLIITIISTAMASLIISPQNEKLYTKYNTQASDAYFSLIKKDISTTEYGDIMNSISYKMDRYGITYSVVSAVCLTGYFGLYQFINNGQTLGKKVFKIAIKSQVKNRKLTISQVMTRAIINNSIYVPTLTTLLVLILPAKNYYIYNQTVQYFGMIVLYTSAFLVLFSKDGRGIHDRITKTRVE